MELINRADTVVRKLLPTVLEAAGRKNAAITLRELESISCQKTVFLASKTLRGLQRKDLRTAESHIKNTTYWCEKAVWAAAVEDFVSFKRYVDAAHACIREGINISPN